LSSNIIQWICDKLIQRINANQRRDILVRIWTRSLIAGLYDYSAILIWGEAKEIPRLKLIVYAMWPYQKFTAADIQREFSHVGLPTEQVSQDLKTLEIYSILTREGMTYRFTYTEFKKLIERHEE